MTMLLKDFDFVCCFMQPNTSFVKQLVNGGNLAIVVYQWLQLTPDAFRSSGIGLNVSFLSLVLS